MSTARGLAAFSAGLLFALGLGLGGMLDPGKVVAFLDVGGDWDPSLAFVMGGAIAVFAPAYRWVARAETSLLGDLLRLPTRVAVDARLLLGAAMFGAGWGLVGYCPGPALVGTMRLGSDVVIVAVSMLIGMAAFSVLPSRKPRA